MNTTATHRTVSADAWKKAKRNGYTHVINGQRYILTASPKGTVLEPVTVVR